MRIHTDHDSAFQGAAGTCPRRIAGPALSPHALPYGRQTGATGRERERERTARTSRRYDRTERWRRERSKCSTTSAAHPPGKPRTDEPLGPDARRIVGSPGRGRRDGRVRDVTADPGRGLAFQGVCWSGAGRPPTPPSRLCHPGKAPSGALGANESPGVLSSAPVGRRQLFRGAPSRRTARPLASPPPQRRTARAAHRPTDRVPSHRRTARLARRIADRGPPGPPWDVTPDRTHVSPTRRSDRSGGGDARDRSAPPPRRCTPP